jgi:hypothetical protein
MPVCLLYIKLELHALIASMAGEHQRWTVMARVGKGEHEARLKGYILLHTRTGASSLAIMPSDASQHALVNCQQRKRR